MEKNGGPNGKFLAQAVNNTYLPLALGKKTMADVNHSLQWGTMMQTTLGMMQDLSKQPGLIGKLGGEIPGPPTEELLHQTRNGGGRLLLSQYPWV